YRVAQETLHNAASHARARHVLVSLTPREEELELSVRDDGCGFDLAAARPRDDGLGPDTLRGEECIMSRTVTDRPKISDLAKRPRRGKGPKAPLRLLLADDHVILLEALRRLLEPDFTILAGVTSGRELVEAALLLKPDVVVSDISMPGMNGLKAGREILEQLPKTRLVILSMHDDPALREEAFRLG